MNLTLWILIIVTVLCMKSTVKAPGGQTASSSSPNPEKNCHEWITEETYSDNFIENRRQARRLSEQNLNGMNIWRRAYTKALAMDSRTESLLPGGLCEFFGQKDTDKMPNITPSGTSRINFKTCPEWIYLSGYQANTGIYNFLHFQNLQKEELHGVLSNCATQYAKFLLDENNGTQQLLQSPVNFCYQFLHIPFNSDVSFNNCLSPYNYTQSG